jgi:predicted Holliday junction resolvase-like endonuclease
MQQTQDVETSAGYPMNIFLVIVIIILVVMVAGILSCLSDIEKKLEKKLDEIIDQLRPIHSIATRRDRHETNAEFRHIEANFRGR